MTKSTIFAFLWFIQATDASINSLLWMKITDSRCLFFKTFLFIFFLDLIYDNQD